MSSSARIFLRLLLFRHRRRHRRNVFFFFCKLAQTYHPFNVLQSLNNAFPAIYLHSQSQKNEGKGVKGPQNLIEGQTIFPPILRVLYKIFE